MAKKKQHNAFWKDIKFKYKLTLTDENSLEEVGSVYFTKLKGIVLIAVILITSTLCALKTAPQEQLTPHRI